MHHSTFFAVIALLPLALTACGEGSAVDAQIKATYREQLVSACTSTASGYVPAGANIDLHKVCGCAADKVMEGKSATDLATTVPVSAEDIAKIRLCATELYPDGVNIKLGG
jgi:curli biogenesis system outer membrane secretion channel CsgG